MTVTFVSYNSKGERIYLWTWNNVKFIPRKDDLIELSALGYTDTSIKGKFAIVQNILWKDKDNTEITLVS